MFIYVTRMYLEDMFCEVSQTNDKYFKIQLR